VAADTRIRILVSTSGDRWDECHAFGVPGRDPRDPHFLAFGGVLFVYTGAWQVPAPGQPCDLNQHLGYAAWSPDGASWEGPRWLEGTYGHYVWRAAAHGGRAYLCGRRRRGFAPGREGEDDPESIEGALLESEDGLVWRHAGLFTEECGDETAFLFEEDGELVAVARGAGPRRARLCRSRPPYRRWDRRDLGRDLGGPLLARWGSRYLVGGRSTAVVGQPRTALFWLVDGQLHPAAELPSGGDTSYPGFVALGPDQGLLSYYSSHQGSGSGRPPAAIYLARLALV
jgi:hypothetical protein